MRGYIHHLGDWAAATHHLSVTEVGVYHRLIEAYYVRSGPLPNDARECGHIAGCRCPSDFAAVPRILRDFFTLESDGLLHQKRCDEELIRFAGLIEQRVSAANARWKNQGITKKTNGAIASSAHVAALLQKRVEKATFHRSQADIVTRGDVPIAQRTPTNGSESMNDANCNANAMHVQCIPNAGIPNTKEGAYELAARARAACVCARERGYRIQETDTQLLALMADGFTAAEVDDAAIRGQMAGKPWAWVVAAIVGRRVDAASLKARMAQEGTKSGAGAPNYPMLPRWDDPH